MNSIFAIIITSSFFTLSGWYLTYLLPRLVKIERVGLSFLLGSGLTTFIWFLGYRVGLPFNLYTLALSGVILSLSGYLLSKYLHLGPEVVPPVKPNKHDKYLTIAIIALIAVAFIVGSYNPLTAWDSIAQYDFRGHAIAIDHDLSFVRAGVYYMSYPLMISLVHAVVYMLGGLSAQGIHSIILAAFLSIIYGRMREWSNTTYALLACLLVIGQNEIFSHATFAYTNLPYTTYLIAGFLYSLSGKLKSQNAKYFLIFGGLLIGISTWMRSSEVFWIIGLILILWQAIRNKNILWAFIPGLTILSMRFAWSSFVQQVFNAANFVTDSTASRFNLDALSKIISNRQTILWYLYLNVISPYLGAWFITLPLLIVALVKRHLRLFMLVSSILISASIVIVGVMIFSTYYTTWNEIGDSARRMMLFVIPLSIISATYGLYVVSQKGNDEK